MADGVNANGNFIIIRQLKALVASGVAKQLGMMTAGNGINIGNVSNMAFI